MGAPALLGGFHESDDADEEAARTGLLVARTALDEARGSRDTEKVKTRRASVKAASAKLRSILDRIRREHESVSDFLFPRTAPLDEIESLLRKNEAVVLYGCSPKWPWRSY